MTHIRYRPANWLNCLAVVCLASVLLSTTVQAAHFCGFQGSNTPAASQLNPASSGTPVCLTCLMASAGSAIILLIAFLVMARSRVFAGSLQMRPRPILDSFQLYIRPPPFGVA